MGLKRARCIRWESANNNSHSDILLLQSLTSQSRAPVAGDVVRAARPSAAFQRRSLVSTTPFPQPQAQPVHQLDCIHASLPTIPINHLCSASTSVSSTAKILYHSRAACLRSEPPPSTATLIRGLSTGHQVPQLELWSCSHVFISSPPKALRSPLASQQLTSSVVSGFQSLLLPLSLRLAHLHILRTVATGCNHGSHILKAVR